MTNHNRGVVLTTSVIAGLTLMSALPGCGGKDQAAQAPAVRRPEARPSPAPQVVRLASVAELMQELGIDQRVRLPENKAPDTTEKRRAVLEFFDAFARGDDAVASGLMTVPDQYELSQLVASGEWSTTTEGIDKVMLETGKSPLGLDCALAIYEVGDSYQPQMWYYTKDGDRFVFEAVSSPPEIMNRLYGADFIKVWFEILAEEDELAMKPDEQPEEIRVNISDVNTEAGGSRTGDGPRGRNPGPSAPIPSPGRGIPGPTPGGG
jgi:hypothetical protein